MRIAVLGGGIIGVTSAWYLQTAGHRVTLFDRQSGPGQETSFANGAQLSAGHAEPWAQPGALLKLLKWLPREDAPLLFRLRLDPAQWAWGLRFLGECRAQRFQDNLRQILALGVYSRQCLHALRAATGIHYDELSLGILNIYEDKKDFAHAIEIARMVRSLGYAREPLSVDEAIRQEPALAHRREALVGATWTPPDESGDAHTFCLALSQVCVDAGVTFRFNSAIEALHVANGRLQGVRVRGLPDDSGGGPSSGQTAGQTAGEPPGHTRAQTPAACEDLPFDACVVALGSYSAALLRPLGVRLSVYPAKGYSATLPLLDAIEAPRASVTDETSKMVFTRLGSRLRIAGTAEFNGYGLALNPVRCAALVQRGQQLFPRAADYSAPLFWTGLRPATPSNRPLIGATRIGGVYLNTGHGTLGWTEACGSAQALSLLIDKVTPPVDFRFLDGR